MATIAQTPDTTTVLDEPVVSEETLLVGTVTMADLRQQHQAPRALRDGEFVATLACSAPGAPSHVLGRRAGGRAYDRVALAYTSGGRTQQRVWALEADRGAQAHYRLLEDTGTRGGFAVAG
ncbi:hypothetical protein LEP48_17365 [Isoptericola sp. NEAU-Y5]|uniref:Uncharacterized protein n=1 Tax=Isoptericola luteus TaxID=2879484 RepID=A0ABS7ZKQ3_9MICO|nr:hypothetical protein [Isoptericola sp. NEAU-Y5]MCA5895102.1 hypothetical protein [Isoptericola sp. NEAU-Y5]